MAAGGMVWDIRVERREAGARPCQDILTGSLMKQLDIGLKEEE